jgi:ketosteroid isomerase-like protein
MMIELKTFLCLALLMVCSCQPPNNKDLRVQWKEEIIQAEKDFAKMAEEEGIPKAFLHFAADEAVLLRNNKLVKGKIAIEARYEGNLEKDDQVSLVWAPDFVDVALSGDLGYTYGPYTYTSLDSLGQKTESEGVFHSVWKRQKDGSWKYVWD